MRKGGYDARFFEVSHGGSLSSARVVVPLLMELVRPASVLDVGCGNGAWLKAFQEAGVSRVHGLDGAGLDPEHLLVAPAVVQRVDFESMDEHGASYDAALCLEVAEHLSPQAGDALVRALTRAAPVVVFSAAIPGQGGTGHCNEQWPAYWRERFAAHGFRACDPLRPRLRSERRVDWWYRQNVLVYATGDALARLPQLARSVVPEALEDEWVHVAVLETARSLRSLLRELPRAAWGAARRRLPGVRRAAP